MGRSARLPTPYEPVHLARQAAPIERAVNSRDTSEILDDFGAFYGAHDAMKG